MLANVVSESIGAVLTEVQVNELARLAREWLFWPDDLADVPNLAASVLAEGFSTQPLATLAGMSRLADRWEIREAFILAMRGLGLDWSELDEMSRADRRSRLCCELIRRGVIDPIIGAQYIAYAEMFELPSSLDELFMPLVALAIEWEEADEPNEAEFGQLILDYLRRSNLGA